MIDCRHPHTELRRRTLSDGSVAYYNQCLTCGTGVGGSVSATKITGNVPPFDDQLLAACKAAQRARRRYREEAARTRFTIWYNKYLKSEAWQKRRTDILQRDRYRCHNCGGHATQVHHLSYRHVGAELPSELAAVCADCHAALHEPPAFVSSSVEQEPPPRRDWINTQAEAIKHIAREDPATRRQRRRDLLATLAPLTV